MSSEDAFWESRVFQSSPEKLWVEPEVGGAGFPGSPQVGEARGCTSYSKRSPRVCCTDPEPEAQGGGILSWDTEHNQAEPELARAPPTTARTQMSPVPPGTVPRPSRGKLVLRKRPTRISSCSRGL